MLSGGVLQPTSSFAYLADLWLANLELRDLAGQAKLSPSHAKQIRTLLNLLFGYALRHDAITRNPVEGTSQIRGAEPAPQALTSDQISAIRNAAATWRTEPGLPGPRSDGQVRDIVEILLGTAMRPGEVLALRPCDIEDLPTGMIASVNGTIIQRKGRGAERQGRPKTDATIRRIAVPDFAAVALRHRRRPAEHLQRAPHLPRVPGHRRTRCRAWMLTTWCT